MLKVFIDLTHDLIIDEYHVVISKTSCLLNTVQT